MSECNAPRVVRVLVPHSIASRGPAIGGQVHAFSGRSMGTTWSVRLVGPARLAREAVARAIQHELDEVVAQMSPWADHTDISRFNRAPAGQWQVLPSAFFDVLQHALAVARDSGGAFDPTAGALVNAWGFGPSGRHDQAGFAPPDGAAIDTLRASSGWHRLQVDAAARRVRQPGGLVLDLSAIAKGHAVDRVSQMLAAQFGFDDSLVEVGGELRGSGLKPDGQPWWVALEMPPAPPAHDGGLPHTRVALHALSVATSGDHRRFFRHDGTRYPHTLDPRDGRPLDNGVALVTVLHPSCMAADALSTALGVLGAERGMAWASARQVAALFVLRHADGSLDERMSPAFAALA
ncbi:MAG: FAD:protein FMN transferase [Rhizobacter sp.]|nr:FAD:protein FMN transferase [Rhizobacter sp.]